MKYCVSKSSIRVVRCWGVVINIIAALIGCTAPLVLAIDSVDWGFGSAGVGAPEKIQTAYREVPPEIDVDRRNRLQAALERTHRQTRPLVKGPPVSTVEAFTVSPESLATVTSPSTSSTGSGGAALGTFTVFGNSSLALGSARSSTNEPSVANNGMTILATYNWYSGISSNNGRTWSYVDPYTAFPTSHGGFCCDQDVIYDGSRNLTMWLLQYGNDSTGNIQRIAVARSQDDVISGNWYYYDFAPINAPCTGAVASDWYDFPQMAVASNNLYVSTNVFTTTDVYRCSVVLRLPLNDIAAANALSYQYFWWAGGTLALTHGATSMMYFGSHLNLSQMRVFNWPESSTTISWIDVNHASFLASGYNCTVGGTTSNPCAQLDSRILASWLRQDKAELGFMWSAAQGVDAIATFAYPYVRTLTVNRDSKALISEPQIWSSSYAWFLPSAGVNARGHIGGTVATAGGAVHPSCSAWLYDDFNVSLVPLENQQVQTGTASPSQNRWGDYLRTRGSARASQQWIGTCYAYESGTITPRVVQFGRERDEICTPDVDGNGSFDAPTDGLLLARAMMGMTGTAVTSGAIGSGARRSTWGTIRNYLNQHCKTNFRP